MCPHTSMLSSTEMLATLSRPQRPHDFIAAPPPRLPGRLGKTWELPSVSARPGPMAGSLARRLRDVRRATESAARFLVDPGVRPALFARKPAIQKMFRHHVAH